MAKGVQKELEASTAAEINVDGITKEFDTSEGVETVFQDVDLQIDPGTFTTIVGKSGSGKSTLMNLISGILEPTRGAVDFSVPDADSQEVTVGHVFQSPYLLPWETCVENIEYVHTSNEDYTDDLAQQYLDIVDLSNHYDKYPSQLSGGQRQRVGIARALSIEPNVLLMDEPFASLDEITAEDLREELMSIWREIELTVLFVTHDLTEAIQLSDRIIMLGDGEIYADLEVPLERPREVDSNEFLKFRERTLEAFYSIEES